METSDLNNSRISDGEHENKAFIDQIHSVNSGSMILGRNRYLLDNIGLISGYCGK
jgi:hypothetical protein